MFDPSHILYEEYSFLPSNRRLRVAYARLNWLCYVYQSVKLINPNWGFKKASGLWKIERTHYSNAL